jgi:hypothetical protein
MLSTIKGRGSTLRFMVMTDLTKDAQGFYKKPATFATAALVLPEVTTSDIPLSIATVSETPVVMYGSAAPGTGEDWADSEPGQASWTVTFSGNVQPVDTDRAAMEALELAAGQRKTLWIEIKPNGETIARGGAMFITAGGFPVPADAAETFTFSGTGRGKRWTDTSAATAAT